MTPDDNPDDDENFRMAGARASHAIRLMRDILAELNTECRISEQVAHHACHEFLTRLKNDDPATRRIMEKIAQIDAHAIAHDDAHTSAHDCTQPK